MRSLTFITVFLLGCLTGHAQYKPTPKFNRDSLVKEAQNLRTIVLKTNPLNYLYGPLLLTAEYRLQGEVQTNPNQSFNLGVSYIGKGSLFRQFLDTVSNPIDLQMRGYRIQAGYRFYLFNNAWYEIGLRETKSGITGIFLSPNASFVNFRVFPTGMANQNNYLSFQLLDFTLDGGMQLRFNRFFIDGFLGFGYKENSYFLVSPAGTTNVGADLDDFIFGSNFKIRGGFNFGISF